MKDILIVVDMQNDFIDGTLGSKQAVEIVPKVVDKIKNWNGPILVTHDTHTKDYMNTMEGKHLPVEHCIENTKGWKLNDQVEDALINKEVILFNKPTFGSTKLINFIKDRKDINSITLVGLCTGICVLSNAIAIKAYLPEVPIQVDSNCCACVTPASHKNALDAMKLCHIDII